MSRRPRSRSARGLPVPILLAYPVWGPIRYGVRRHRRKQTVTKKDLSTMVKAVKDGKGEKAAELIEAAQKLKAERWHYKNRHVMIAFWVALALMASKASMFGPGVLPLFGLLVVGGCLVAFPKWLLRTSPKPLPVPRAMLLDRLPSGTPGKLRAVLSWLLSPRAGATFTFTFGLWWWGAGLSRPRATLVWVIAVFIVLGVRAWRFRVRVFDTSTGTPEGDWATFIAAKKPSAVDSYLQGTSDFVEPRTGRRLGWSGGVVLPQGSDGATVVAPALRGAIATTYGVGVEDIMVERFEKHDGGFDERRFVLTVLDEPGSNAVRQLHEYDGATFNPATGVWVQAYRADWKPGFGQLFDPEIGGFSTHFSGETGGGKSEGMETMLREITSGGVVAPYIIDLGEATFVDWRDRVEIFITRIEDAVVLLENHVALIKLRNKKLGQLRQYVDGEDVGPRRIYPVSAAYPCIPGVMDEWEFALGHPTFGKAIMEATRGIVTQQRKVIVPMIAAGQSTGLQRGFRNDSTIRTQFQAGTMIAFKNNAESGHQAFGKQVRVNPSELPLNFKGSCYMTSNVDARDAMARSRWVRRPKAFDGQIRIPDMPSDEVDVLTRGLSIRPTLVQVPANAPSSRSQVAQAEHVAAKSDRSNTLGQALEQPTYEGVQAALEALGTEDAQKALVALGMAPSEPQGPPELHVVPPLAPPPSSLAADVLEFVLQQERPIRAAEVIKEFRNVRTRAGSRAVEGALAELKRQGLLTADARGYYSSPKKGAVS